MAFKRITLNSLLEETDEKDLSKIILEFEVGGDRDHPVRDILVGEQTEGENTILELCIEVSK